MTSRPTPPFCPLFASFLSPFCFILPPFCILFAPFLPGACPKGATFLPPFCTLFATFLPPFCNLFAPSLQHVFPRCSLFAPFCPLFTPFLPLFAPLLHPFCTIFALFPRYLFLRLKYVYEYFNCFTDILVDLFFFDILLQYVSACNPLGMYPESPLDGIPTGRNPHWTESPPNFLQWGFRTLVSGIPTERNPHSSAHIAFKIYCNLAFQRHCEL